MNTPQPTDPQHPFVRAVAGALRRRCGVAAAGRVVVAVSGGCDSVALLRALSALAPRRRWRLSLAVGHVQHHLRGELAEQDAEFVEALADRLDLPFLRADLDLSSTPSGKTENLEAAARRQRYQALATMARTFEAPFIATGHHGDDQLETLLLRLLRGTGVAGLRGIAWRRRLTAPTETETQTQVSSEAPPPEALLVIRPMLATTREQAASFLGELGQPWREDHTNAEFTRDRARLRHEVLPVLRQLRGDAPRRAVGLSDHARQVHALIQAEVDRHHEHVHRSPPGTPGDATTATLDRGEAKVMPAVVLTALLRRLLVEMRVPGDRLGGRTLRPIVRAIRDRRGGERRYELAGGVRLYVRRNEVQIERG